MILHHGMASGTLDSLLLFPCRLLSFVSSAPGTSQQTRPVWRAIKWCLWARDLANKNLLNHQEKVRTGIEVWATIAFHNQTWSGWQWVVLNFDPCPALPGRSFHGWVRNCKHADLPCFAYWIGINLGIIYTPLSDPHGSWTFSLLVTCSLFLVVGIVGIALQWGLVNRGLENEWFPSTPRIFSVLFFLAWSSTWSRKSMWVRNKI